jgi:hypothetical protein
MGGGWCIKQVVVLIVLAKPRQEIH